MATEPQASLFNALVIFLRMQDEARAKLGKSDVKTVLRGCPDRLVI